MKISFDGINSTYVTFYADSTVQKDMLVKMTDNETVGICGKSELPIGKAIDVINGEYAIVQINGYIHSYYSGSTTPTLVWCSLYSDEYGGVCVDETGSAPKYRVVTIDRSEGSVGFFI